METVNEYQDALFNALCALNALLQTKEMCCDDKMVIKVNRFRKLLIDRLENHPQETENK